MTDEVESMSYTGEVPWHGLGVSVEKAPNVEKMIKLAGLDWNVELRPLQFGEMNGKGFKNAVGIDNFKALVRDKDTSLLDVVGSMYVPTQNREAFQFFNEFVEAGDASMETAGSLREGKYVWGLAKLRHDFAIGKNDKVRGYILVVCPHQQGKSLLMKTTAVRVVCNNTLQMALRETGGEFRMVHRQKFDAKMMQKAKETIGLAREQIDEFEANAVRLKKTKMGEEDVLELYLEVFNEEPFDTKHFDEKLKNASSKVQRVFDCYENAPGADVGTAWGALNGVTYYVDHIACQSQDRRLQQAWWGKGAAQKNKTLELLLV